MVEKTERTAGSSGPRSADGRRFEVFVREAEPDPLRHVGTVAAPTPDVAHEEASKLFAWYARDVWVCPAEETHRYSAGSPADDTRSDSDASPDGDGTNRNDGRSDGESVESRVYEETQGTPAVGCGSAPVDGETDDGDPSDDATTTEDSG